MRGAIFGRPILRIVVYLGVDLFMEKYLPSSFIK